MIITIITKMIKQSNKIIIKRQNQKQKHQRNSNNNNRNNKIWKSYPKIIALKQSIHKHNQ